MNYQQLKLQLEKSNAPDLTYSERDAVLAFLDRIHAANMALIQETQRLLKERNGLLVALRVEQRKRWEAEQDGQHWAELVRVEP